MNRAAGYCLGVAGTAVLALTGILLAPVSGRASEHAVTGRAAYNREAYDEAVEAYREGLLDEPDSLLLRFNLGAALYKLGHYDEAARAFTAVAASGEDEWLAPAAYNLGNTLYRIGEQTEPSDSEAAAVSYQQALLAYRRAMAADPTDTDPKYGHEFVESKLQELRERQAEQERSQQQEQQGNDDEEQAPSPDGDEATHGEDQDQQQRDEQGDQAAQEEGQQPSGEADADTPEDQQRDEQSKRAEDHSAVPPEPTRAGQGGRDSVTSPAEDQREHLDRQAARAILDTARAEELGPEEIARDIGVAGEGEPTKRW